MLLPHCSHQPIRCEVTAMAAPIILSLSITDSLRWFGSAVGEYSYGSQ